MLVEQICFKGLFRIGFSGSSSFFLLIISEIFAQEYDSPGKQPGLSPAGGDFMIRSFVFET